MSGSGEAPAGFDPARFMAYVRQVGHGGALGIDYVAHGEDWAELSLPYNANLVGMPQTGVIASGPIISLMDMATSVAIWVRLGRFRHQATLDLRVDYLRPATPGRTVIGGANVSESPAASPSCAAPRTTATPPIRSPTSPGASCSRNRAEPRPTGVIPAKAGTYEHGLQVTEPDTLTRSGQSS
jgi:uncharacterized protein (TIGR00369 family)